MTTATKETHRTVANIISDKVEFGVWYKCVDGTYLKKDWIDVGGHECGWVEYNPKDGEIFCESSNHDWPGVIIGVTYRLEVSVCQEEDKADPDPWDERSGLGI